MLELAEERLREYEEIHSEKSFRDIIEMLECDEDDDELIISAAANQTQEVIDDGITDIPIAEPLSDSHGTLGISADTFAAIDPSDEVSESKFSEQAEQIIISLEGLF